MSTLLSTLATSQALALTKGPLNGPSAVTTPTNLRVLDASVELPVGAPIIDISEGDYARFGILPKGAKIIPNLSSLVTTHTAKIAGKLVLVPVDGTGSNQEITGVTAQLETIAASGNSESLETRSILEAAASVTVAEDSWIQFVPDADLTVASSAKVLYARIAYAIP